MSEEQASHQSTILIVEGDADLRNHYRTMLEDAGFLVVEADGYDQALARMDSSVDLALLDLMPGEKSGLDVLRYNRQKFPFCPSIMISACADKDSAIAALHEGAVAYLEKPVDHFELIHNVKHWTDFTALKSSQVRLQDQRCAHEALSETSERLAAILESMSDAVVSVDASQKIILFNKGAEKVFGYTQDEILGQALELLIPEPLRANHVHHMNSFDKESVSSRVMKRSETTEGLRKNGEIFPAESTISKITVNGKHVFTAVLHDITQRMRTEAEREQLLEDSAERVKELQCIYGLSESIRTRQHLDEVLQDAANLIPPGWHYPEITRGKVVFAGKEYVSEPFAETAWKQSSAILLNGEPAGVIEVYYLKEMPELDEGPFMKEERHLIDSMAKAISQAIVFKQSADELQEYINKLERFKKLAVGRELKMVELKREINTLLQELGREEKYGRKHEQQ